MLETVLYSLKLFVVGGEHIAMVMVVVGHIRTQNVMGVHNTIYLLVIGKIDPLPELPCSWYIECC